MDAPRVNVHAVIDSSFDIYNTVHIHDMYSLKLEWLHVQQDKHITMCMSFKTTRAVGIKQAAAKLQTDAARIRCTE